MSYSEDQLMQDVKESSKFFEDIFEREIARLKQNIAIDYRVAKPGWEVPYGELIDVCKKINVGPSKLQDALDEAKIAQNKLNIAVEQEIAQLRTKTSHIIKNMDNVSEAKT
jgi:hypothetical protein